MDRLFSTDVNNNQVSYVDDKNWSLALIIVHMSSTSNGIQRK